MPKAKVAVLISGSGTNMAALLFASRHADCPYEIVLVASNNPDASGLHLAQAEGVPIFAHSHSGMSRDAHDLIMHERLIQSGAEFVALAGYMRILSAGFVEKWANKLLNIHPSLLPLYKGLHTHKRALEAGDDYAGCTVHIVTPELDDGEILGQTKVRILDGDTQDSLAARVLIAEHQLYSRVLANFVLRERSPEFLIEQVRKRALSLPESDEVMSHGMPCFGIIKGKKFAYVARNHHEDGKTALLVKISGLDEQTHLIETDPGQFYRPQYFGDRWIGMRIDLGNTDWEDIANWLKRSWTSIAPARLRQAHMIADDF